MKLNFFSSGVQLSPLARLSPKKNNVKIELGLDIGNEAVKALFFKKSEKGIKILGAGVEFFERFGVFDSRDFEKEVFSKAILKAVIAAKKSSFLSLADKSEKKQLETRKDWKVRLALPPNILKARILRKFLTREKPKEKISKIEAKNIFQFILEEAKKEIAKNFSLSSGILPSDIQWISLEIIESKIDGYFVRSLEGYEGKKLEFRILAVFIPKYYLERIEDILKNLNFGISSIIHIAEGLKDVYNKEEGIFLDIGGDYTQIFIVKCGILEKIAEFSAGGRLFSKRLSEGLLLDEQNARILKERYAENSLRLDTKKRIKEILIPAKNFWYENFKNEIQKINLKELLPSTVFLFGGGSLTPEIQDVLKENLANDQKLFPMADFPKVEFIKLNINLPESFQANWLQIAPLLLISQKA